MTLLEAKTQYYEMRGFTETFEEFVQRIAELDGLEGWAHKETSFTTIPPLPFEKPKKHLSRFLP